MASFTRGGGSAGLARATRMSSSALRRLLRGARDAPHEVQKVPLEMPVVGGIVRARPIQKRERRRTRLGAVNFEKREQQAPAFALLLPVQFLDEPSRGEAREERQDPAESLVVSRVLAKGAHVLEVHGSPASSGARFRPSSPPTWFSETIFSAASSMRDARAREPWLSCSTAALTISLNRLPTSSGFSGSVTMRRIAAVGAPFAVERACSRGAEGAETGH